jgi:integral membrane sensor domain MASE1/two-component sensor histidine kinase
MDVESADEGWQYFPLQVIVLAALYVASGWFGLGFAFDQEFVTLIWPPTGLSLAALIVLGPRLWVGVWLGVFSLSLLNGAPLSVALGFSVGNTLMPVVGAWLVQRFTDFRPSLERIRDVIALVSLGGVVAATISAVLGVTTLWLNGLLATPEISQVAWNWWRGDLAGVVAVAPVLLLLKSGHPRWGNLFRATEFWGVSGLMCILLVLAYADLVPVESERSAIRLTLLVVFWASIRLGMRGTVLINTFALSVSAVATAAGHGPIASDDPVAADGLLWLYYMVAGLASLTLAAAVSERRVLEESHHSKAIDKMQSEREDLLTVERDSIMREMHDGIGAQLTSILSMVQRGSATNDEISEALRRALDDMRLMIDPFSARDVGLPIMLGRLRASLESPLKRNGLQATWQIDAHEALERLDPKQSLHVLRVIQEAIANVVQHAHATEIEIRIAHADPSAQMLEVAITDNGVGSAPSSTSGGHGTRNMTARAEALGAEISFHVHDSGRSVRLLIPV